MNTVTPVSRVEEDHQGVRTAPAGKWNIPASGTALPKRHGSADPQIAKFILTAMRGRWWVAIVFGLACGVVSAVAAWHFTPKGYESSGILKIAYTLPEVMAKTDQNGPVPMFDALMTSQKLLITSRRVIDMAVQDPVWKATGRPAPVKADEYYAEHLTVNIRPRSEFIVITVSDPDPGMAAAAVTAIVNAYSDLYNSQVKQLDRQRLGVLEDRQTALQMQIEQMVRQIDASAKEFGTADLSSFHEAATTRVMNLEQAVSTVRLAIAKADWPADEAAAVKSTGGGPPAAGSRPMTVEQIAMNDPTMRGYLDRQIKLQEELEQLLARGLGERHNDVVRAKMALAAAQHRVEHYGVLYRQCRETALPAAGVDAKGGQVQTEGKSLSELQATQASLNKLLDEAKQEMVALGTKQTELQRQTEQMQRAQEQLQSLTARMNTLRNEGSIGGRLSIISSGEVPLSPVRDRRAKMAAAGGLAGASLPMSLLLGLAFIRRTYRYCEETETAAAAQSLPMLGVLPEIRHRESDPEREAMTANCVHQIRVRLRAAATTAGCHSYLVTSANAGEGKSSLALSLALSFAASHSRTLIIDADLVGQHLTASLKATDVTGLCEAMDCGHLRGHVLKTPEQLYVLPAGRSASAVSAGHLSVKAIKRVLEEARQHFDVVIVDSGPILGRIEAATVAQEVDGTVFVISRGQDQSAVQNALRRLHSLRVKVEGLVFNRAKDADLLQSSFGSSWRGSMRSVSHPLRLMGDLSPTMADLS